MPRKNPFVRVGRPPAPTSAFGAMRPKTSRSMGPSGVGAGMAPPAFGGASPMTGFNPAVPTASFGRGGNVPCYHDDERLERGHSEHGHQSFQKMCRGGKS